MKKFILLSFCSVIYSFTVQGQDLNNVMRYNFEYDAKNHNPKEGQPDVYSTSMALDISGDYSRFAAISTLEVLQTIEQVQKGNQNNPTHLSGFMQARKPGQRRINFRVYNSPEQMGTYESLLMDKYYIVDPSDQIQWEILPEVFTYNDFTVQKAQTQFGGRTWQVYFTQDIPLFEGPYKFKNLPGFVVFAQDSEQDHTFTFINSEKINLHSWTFTSDQKAIKVNKKQFDKAREIASNKTIGNLLNERGGSSRIQIRSTDNSTAQDINNTKLNLKGDNPIER